MTLHMANTATTDFDPAINVLADTWIEESRYPRRLKRFALVGSDDCGDLTVTIKYGTRIIAVAPNSVEDAAALQSNYMNTVSSREICLPQEELSFEIYGTASTTTVSYVLEIEEVKLGRPRRRGRRGFRGRRGYRRYRRRY